MKRASGILIPITALPSRFGVGDLGPGAYAFIDFCKKAGQSLWQVLPINPTDGINGHSPYSSPSAFAGNPLFISPELLYEQGLLKKSEISKGPRFRDEQVDYVRAFSLKDKLLSKAFERFRKKPLPVGYEDFIAQATWLEDYAFFVVIKRILHGASWNQWPLPLRKRDPKSLKVFADKHRAAMDKIKFIQFSFYQQWVMLKAYANAQGIGIIGDIPIYVNADSADVWCHPSLFQVDAQGQLKFVSGCPPDYFSKTGQRWGNPTYNWSQLKTTHYTWWIERMRHNLALFDMVRVDHFRGFMGFWQIPAYEKLAVFGRWVKGPGAQFFRALKKEFGSMPLIAEDLGEITPDVNRVMKTFGFPGMRVMLFGFGSDIKHNPHVAANFQRHCVAYTGTHDNNTIQGWLGTEAKDYEKANLAKVLGVRAHPDQIHWAMIEVLEKSKAQTVIIPMQDVLGLGAQARLNTPATKVNNWVWRLAAKQMTEPLAKALKILTVKAGRYGKR